MRVHAGAPLPSGVATAQESSAVARSQTIAVRGAREHNLVGVDVDIPRDQLVVITGLSGSGKSSLAFDTIYAEGQRRYVESLSAYARQFLETMRKPDVDHIEGLSPAISIEQKTTSRNPRSTVATVTEVYDYLRLLYARVGTAYSPATGLPIEAQSVAQMTDRILALDSDTRAVLYAPVVRGRKGEYRAELADLRKRGFQRVRVDGEPHELDSPPQLDRKIRHDIDVVVDRIVVRPGIESRLADSLQTALGLADGIAVLEPLGEEGERIVFSANFACPVSGFTIPEIEPRLFSFNAPYGACPACDGLGREAFFDPDLVVPDPSLSLEEGAVHYLANSSSRFANQVLQAVARHFTIGLTTPWKDLPKKARDGILYGTGADRVKMSLADESGRRRKVETSFEGVLTNIERRYKETSSLGVRESLERYLGERHCGVCEGQRLRPESLCVKIAGLNIAEVTRKNVTEALAWTREIEAHLTPQRQTIAAAIVKEIEERLGFLANVGLDYLTLDRRSGSLSGGESQRIRLASQIGSGLSGVLYVLDEPSIGLHPRDHNRLLDTLKGLRDRGNSVLVVEHDEETMRAADHLVDLGPGAGVHGGRLVATGTVEQVEAAPESVTGDYLAGRRKIAVPKSRRKGNDLRLAVRGATGNNLQSLDVEFPLGCFVCVTGVSGSGKSTLVVDTLYGNLARTMQGARVGAAPCEEIQGQQWIDKVIDIDQSPIGRTPRSNPATYTGTFTPIREWFTELPESRARGYRPGRFSFNVRGGRCEACQGEGLLRVEMHFLPDVHVECDECRGRRFNRETLEVHYRGKSIADVLEMTVDAGHEFFSAVPAIRERLATLRKVGLGYIKIGQSATTLSGGEAQRVKLAKELSRRATGRTLYILDEPTTGLHFHDVGKLLEVLHALVDQGNTVVVIEHNLDVIKTADWIIDLGPEGGDGGGLVVVTGTPEKVAGASASHSGQYLKPYLKTAAGSGKAAAPRRRRTAKSAV